MRILFLAATLIALPAQAQNAPRGDAQLRAAMLATHNAERRIVGVKRIAWSDALAADARVHAEYLARTGKFEHSTGNNQGENLWAGTRGAYRYEDMSGGWAAEKRYYKDAPSPNNSTTGKWSDVGHYTQMVWATTTMVGCALASNADRDYLVCRYSPPGNYSGQKAYQPVTP